MSFWKWVISAMSVFILTACGPTSDSDADDSADKESKEVIEEVAAEDTNEDSAYPYFGHEPQLTDEEGIEQFEGRYLGTALHLPKLLQDYPHLIEDEAYSDQHLVEKKYLIDIDDEGRYSAYSYYEIPVYRNEEDPRDYNLYYDEYSGSHIYGYSDDKKSQRTVEHIHRYYYMNDDQSEVQIRDSSIIPVLVVDSGVIIKEYGEFAFESTSNLSVVPSIEDNDDYIFTHRSIYGTDGSLGDNSNFKIETFADQQSLAKNSVIQMNDDGQLIVKEEENLIGNSSQSVDYSRDHLLEKVEADLMSKELQRLLGMDNDHLFSVNQLVLIADDLFEEYKEKTATIENELPDDAPKVKDDPYYLDVIDALKSQEIELYGFTEDTDDYIAYTIDNEEIIPEYMIQTPSSRSEPTYAYFNHQLWSYHDGNYLN